MPGLVLAIGSGALLAAAFPPLRLTWLAWVGLVPLLWVVLEAERPLRAALFGFAGGFVFCLLVLQPLASARAWTGWAELTAEQMAQQAQQRALALYAVQIGLAVVGALAWSLYAVLLHALRGRVWRVLVAAPCLWILVAEWLRSWASWRYTWAYLGNATVDIGPLRQLAAWGGVWLLSAVVVLVNAALWAVLRQRRETAVWRPVAAAAGVVAIALFAGALRLNGIEKVPTKGAVEAAAVQYQKQGSYTSRDYAPFGMEKGYLRLVRQVSEKGPQLIVLPETVAIGAITVDGTHSTSNPDKPHGSLADLDRALRQALGGRPSVVVLGLETVRQGQSFNSLGVWTAEGPQGWYDKRRLVPFGESTPAWARALGLSGRSQYQSGRGAQLVTAAGLTLGGFVCQEVLTPHVFRETVRAGARLLVTGGNDGVFANPAVAAVHADVARLRAVETGRYLVRAMKTGVSAIIDPAGREMARSPGSRPTLLLAKVAPLSYLTLYARFGDWPLLAAAALVTGLVVHRAVNERGLAFSPRSPDGLARVEAEYARSRR